MTSFIKITKIFLFSILVCFFVISCNQGGHDNVADKVSEHMYEFLIGDLLLTAKPDNEWFDLLHTVNNIYTAWLRGDASEINRYLQNYEYDISIIFPENNFEDKTDIVESVTFIITKRDANNPAEIGIKTVESVICEIKEKETDMYIYLEIRLIYTKDGWKAVELALQ